MSTTILVIDDDITLGNALEHVLKINNFHVITTTDAKVGIEIAINTSVDLIICDYKMPEISGSDVINILKQDNRTAHIPVIIATGYEESRLSDIPVHITKLMKPFDIGTLFVTVERSLRVSTLSS